MHHALPPLDRLSARASAGENPSSVVPDQCGQPSELRALTGWPGSQGSSGFSRPALPQTAVIDYTQPKPRHAIAGDAAVCGQGQAQVAAKRASKTATSFLRPLEGLFVSPGAAVMTTD
jgi:hypothetical protein